jgi:hypothetical protein
MMITFGGFVRGDRRTSFDSCEGVRVDIRPLFVRTLMGADTRERTDVHADD